MEPIVLRPANPSDADAVAAYHRRCFADTFAALLASGRVKMPERDGIRGQLAQWYQPGSGFLTTVAVAGDRPVGHVTVSGHQLVHLFVDPDHQGIGLGRRLLALGETALAAAGHQEFELHTRVENLSALAFYQASGWTVTDRLVRTVEHGIAYNEHILIKARP